MGGASGRFFPSANTHHSLPHLHRHGVTSTASHIHHSNSHHLKIFASTQPGAVSTLHIIRLYSQLFLLVPTCLRSTGIRTTSLFLRSLIWLRNLFLVSFVCSNFQNFFASPWWEKGALGGGSIFSTVQKSVCSYYIGSM